MFDADIFRPTDVWLAAKSHATGCVATRKICVVYVSSKLIKGCVTGVEWDRVWTECAHIFFGRWWKIIAAGLWNKKKKKITNR